MADTIRVLLVDDEEYVVDALKRHIHWEELGMEIVGEAYDGQEGIEKTLQLSPDCIITDITMPQLDGISMIEQLYHMSSHPYFLIYTGYNDFEYAKKAISYGVSDYILKPALPEDFEAPLEAICSRIREERSQIIELDRLQKDFEESKQLLFQPFLDDLLEGRILTYDQFSRKDQFFSSKLTGREYVVIGVHLESIQEVFDELEVEKQLYTLYKINSLVISLIPGMVYSPGFRSNTAYFLCADQKDSYSLDQLTSLCIRILDFCNRIGDLNLAVRIGLSDIVHSFEEITIAFRQAQDCIRESSANEVMQYSHHCIKVEGSPLSWIFDKEQLIDAILIGNSSVAQQLLEKFFSHVSQLPAPQDIYLTPLLSELIGATTVSLLQHGIEYDLKAFSLVVQKHSTIHEAQIHITEYIQSLIDSIQSRELAKNYQIVHRMISIAKEHFSEGITLSEIADQLQFTPNYLSTLFAKSMGISFSQYLAKLRIFKAKELLDSGKYKVYEVGDMVGYKNPEYFTKVFKEFVGITPSAYAK